jgi:hypothetical protein
MNATGATLVFLVPLAALGLATAHVESIGVALLSLALTLPAGAFTFWLGARRVRHKWYSAFISGVLVVVVVLQTIGFVKLVFPLWLQLSVIEVAIAAVSFWLGSRPPFPEKRSPVLHTAASEHPQQTDYIYVGVVCLLVFGVVPVGVAAFSLQRLSLQPADSVLFGSTLLGEIMCLVPIILIGFVLSMMAAWPLTRWIRRGLGMPEIIPPFPIGSWVQSTKQSLNWRLAGGIAGAILITVEAKGLGSYFYVTESGVSVRPPLDFSMRHYEWKDVTTVSVRCIRSMVKSKNRFRYILKMSDGYEVDLSTALGATTEKVRAAYAARFAESIPSHLNTVPSILYEFDVSQDGLAVLGEKRGTLLPNAIREQVLAHGGTLQ